MNGSCMVELIKLQPYTIYAITISCKLSLQRVTHPRQFANASKYNIGFPPTILCTKTTSNAIQIRRTSSLHFPFYLCSPAPSIASACRTDISGTSQIVQLYYLWVRINHVFIGCKQSNSPYLYGLESSEKLTTKNRPPYLAPRPRQLLSGANRKFWQGDHSIREPVDSLCRESSRRVGISHGNAHSCTRYRKVKSLIGEVQNHRCYVQQQLHL